MWGQGNLLLVRWSTLSILTCSVLLWRCFNTTDSYLWGRTIVFSGVFQDKIPSSSCSLIHSCRNLQTAPLTDLWVSCVSLSLLSLSLMISQITGSSYWLGSIHHDLMYACAWGCGTISWEEDKESCHPSHIFSLSCLAPRLLSPHPVTIPQYMLTCNGQYRGGTWDKLSASELTFPGLYLKFKQYSSQLTHPAMTNRTEYSCAYDVCLLVVMSWSGPVWTGFLSLFLVSGFCFVSLSPLSVV